MTIDELFASKSKKPVFIRTFQGAIIRAESIDVFYISQRDGNDNNDENYYLWANINDTPYALVKNKVRSELETKKSELEKLYNVIDI